MLHSLSSSFDKAAKIEYDGLQRALHSLETIMPAIYVALIVGFVLGLLVGFTLRNEPRRFPAEGSHQEDAEHQV